MILFICGAIVLLTLAFLIFRKKILEYRDKKMYRKYDQLAQEYFNENEENKEDIINIVETPVNTIIEEIKQEPEKIIENKTEILELEEIEEPIKESFSLTSELKKEVGDDSEIHIATNSEYLEEKQENYEDTFKNYILELINSSPDYLWRRYEEKKYSRLYIKELVCPECGHQGLYIKVWDNGNIRVSDDEGFRETGCKYSFIVKENKRVRGNYERRLV